MKRRYFLRIALLFLLPLLIFSTGLAVSDFIIAGTSKGFLYSKIENVPFRKAGLLLGTSKYIKKGELNPYFLYRMEAAALLYRTGKIRYIIASGDNRQKNYNEPESMKKFLLEKGIPASAIYLDYAGFRTLDSVVRCKRIFEQQSFTVISQKFHNERAVYIARHFEIDAIGFNAQGVDPPASLSTRTREIFARAKAFVDLYLTEKQPRFLGKSIKLPE